MGGVYSSPWQSLSAESPDYRFLAGKVRPPNQVTRGDFVRPTLDCNPGEDKGLAFRSRLPSASTTAYSAFDVRRARHIGDFSNWHQHPLTENPLSDCSAIWTQPYVRLCPLFSREERALLALEGAGFRNAAHASLFRAPGILSRGHEGRAVHVHCTGPGRCCKLPSSARSR